MGRTKTTIEERAEAFKEHKFYVSDSNIMMCRICNSRLDWDKLDNLKKHVVASGHLKKKAEFEKKLAAGQAPKRQATLGMVLNNQKKAKEEKLTFIGETVKMCLQANIPMNKLDHPAVREYLKKYIPGSGDLPCADTLRRDYVPAVGEAMKEDIKEAIKDKKIVVVVDETSDCKGRCVLAILFRTNTASDSQEVFLANCVFLDNATGSTCCQAIVTSLTSYGVEYENVMGLVSDSAPYMTTCFNALNVLLGEHLLHFKCWAHKVNLAGDIFMKELTTLNQFVSKTKMAFLNARKMKSAYVKYLQDNHPDLRAVLFPSPIVTRWNSWFHSVEYLDKYADALIAFINQYDARNASAEFLSEQFADPAIAQELKLQMTFVAEACQKFVSLINVLEGSKYPYGHLLWDELNQLRAALKRYSDGSFPPKTLVCINSIQSVVKREAIKQLLRGCTQKSLQKLVTHMSPSPTNNFYQAAGQLFNPAIAAQTVTPNVQTVQSCYQKLALTFSKISEDLFVEGYTYFHEQLSSQVRAGSKVDLIQIMLAMNQTNPVFATAALQTIWAPVNSVDAERFFSQYNLVLTDRRTRMKEDTIETCAMLTFNK